MRTHSFLAMVVVLVLAPWMISVPASGEDDSIEPDTDRICAAIANACAQTCYSNDPNTEYPALQENCTDNCLADEEKCKGNPAAPTKGAGAEGGVPSGGAGVDAGPRQPANQNLMTLQHEFLLLTPDQ